MSRQQPKAVAIVGAGLAGAACANAFALAGFKATVFERGAAPAAGASDVPLAMFAPSVSADDAPHSRLLRRGVHLLMTELQRLTAAGRLVEGIDWAQTGVLERCIRSDKKLPSTWLEPQDPPALQSRRLTKPSAERPVELLHGAAGWVRPDRLIAAWLDHPSIAVQTRSSIHHWDELIALPFDVIVVAAGHQSAQLVPALADVLQPIRGQVEWGVSSGASQPINGMGHWIEGSGRWLCGATFQRDESELAPRARDVDLNFGKLTVLRPELGKPELARLRTESTSWIGVRVAQKNRAPLILQPHPIEHPNLWVCTALGSRGLSLAALCSQQLAGHFE
jgi:tRNA 5-methylaminomethyl-2-thiouridine biosynthesis bifunctional protein